MSGRLALTSFASWNAPSSTGESCTPSRAAAGLATKYGEWAYEVIPSSRDEDFIERARWEDWEDAAYMAQHLACDEAPWLRRMR